MHRQTKQNKLVWSRAVLHYVRGNELLLALVVALVVIAVGVAFGWENNKLVPSSPASSSHYLAEPHNRLSFMANWDGPDYLAIVKHGYVNPVQTNFFPLYPLLIRLVQFAVHSPLDSGLLVSWAFFVGAIYFYLKILKRLYGIQDNLEALRGALFFVLFPTAVFLIAVYTESLFAFLALGALYYALQKKWLPAALFTLFVTAAHANGIFVLVLVALVLLEQRERLSRIVAGMIIGVLGLLSYMTYLQLHFHNALAFVDSQKTNGWLHYGLDHLLASVASRSGVFLVLVIVSVIYWWKRRKSFAIYSLLYACIVLLGGLGAYGRYALMAFPVQFMLYEYFRDKKLAFPVVLSLMSIFWAYFMLQYAGGYAGG